MSITKKRLAPIHSSRPLLFVLPAAILFLIFYMVPAFLTLRYSFTRWDGYSPDVEFVGLQNYQTLITADPVFTSTVSNSLRFMLVVVVFQTLFSLILGLMLVRNTKTGVALRTLYFFPTILSSISVGLIWLFMYDPFFGLINYIFREVGLTTFQPSWLGNEKIALYSLAATQVWFHTGQMMVVYVAGLQQIPQELYEAASVDGANAWRKFVSITWPLLLPTTILVMAYTTLQSFRAFELVWSMTQGGPGGSTEILPTLIYRTGMLNLNVGLATAQSVVFMLLIFSVFWIQRRAVKLTT
jgi:raffinose/stachyose/melibiose transport system permease protein